MEPNFKKVAAIVLAAGESTRFNFGKPASFQKVMLKVSGKPILATIVELLEKLKTGKIVIVIGHKGYEVKKYFGKKVDYAVQKRRLGTGHAVLCGLKKVSENFDTILVINGDDSFRYKLQTLSKFLEKHQKSFATLTFLTVIRANPFGLGRVVRGKNGHVLKIVEEKDATDVQRKIKEVNCGAYIFQKKWLQENISKLRPSPITSEYYIVGLVEFAVKQGVKVETFRLEDPAEWFGVNTPEELALANKL